MRGPIRVQISPEHKAAIELVNMAVSNTAGGVVEFHTGGTSGDYAGSSIDAAFQHDPAADKRLQTVRVATTTLDEYLPSRLPNLATTTSSRHHIGVHALHVALESAAADAKELYIVKIDTQGFDGVVIEGMKEILRYKQVHNRTAATLEIRKVQRGLCPLSCKTLCISVQHVVAILANRLASIWKVILVQQSTICCRTAWFQGSSWWHAGDLHPAGAVAQGHEPTRAQDM